tara:strand:+ start:4201 stop:5451 length:1251 start_codon:yes stop_codon:yes gene_type:complete
VEGKRRVVVTGLGTLAPNGLSTEKYWAALLNGDTGIDYIKKFDTTDFRVQIGAELKDFDAEDFGVDRKVARRNDLCTQYAICSARMAVEDSGLNLPGDQPERVGVIYGSGIGGIWTFEEQHRNLVEKGPRKISPFFIPMMIADMTSGQVSIEFGAKGPNYTTVSACSSAGHAIGNAYREIQNDEADVMITGGTEAAVSRMALGGFASMKALSTRNDEPARASRPFDMDRDGFVLGEGSGGLILESLEHAIARGARIYAEIVGTGYTADAYHITDMAPGGEGGVRAMRKALSEAGLGPEAVDYVNAHGTSTPIGDRTETAALKTVFGDHTRKLVVSSTKSMTGHLLGASGAIEAIACILAIRDNTVPPTINYEKPDPECDLDYVPNEARNVNVSVCLNNSFGFGGHNAVLVIREFQE